MKLFFTVFLITCSLLYVQAQDSEFHLDKTYKINPNGTVTLKASDARVYIKGTNRKDVHVKIDRTLEVTGYSWGENEFEVNVYEENGNLDIIENSNGSVNIVGAMSEKYEIWIEAPKGISLSIDGDDDDYFIEEINGSISIDADDSDIRLSNCGGRQFDFNIDDGDITMDRGAGKISVDADDADVTIKNASFTDVYANFDDGDFHLETSLSDNGEYEFNGDDSSFEMIILSGGGKFNINHDDGSTHSSKDFEVIQNSEDRTVLKLGNGNAKIYFNTDDASVRLSTL